MEGRDGNVSERRGKEGRGGEEKEGEGVVGLGGPQAGRCQGPRIDKRRACLSNLCVRSSASAICSNWHSTGSTRPDYNWTTKFRS